MSRSQFLCATMDSEDRDLAFDNVRKDGGRCTDCLCCILFVGAIGGLVALGTIGVTEGNMDALQQFVSGTDYNGHVCGQDEVVKDFPLTYFTLPLGVPPVTSWGSVERAKLKPVCTTTCPENSESFPSLRKQGLCPEDALTQNFCTWYGGNTTHIANYCIDSQVFHAGANLAVWFEDLSTCWVALACTPVASILFGFIFFWIVYQCGTFIIWIALLIVAAVPGVFGVILFMHANSEDSFGFVDSVASDFSPQQQKTAAYVLWSISGIVLLLLACLCHTINAVGKVIGFASDFISDTPSQILQPLFFVAAQIVVLAACVPVFVLVLSINSSEGDEQACITDGDFYCVQWSSDIQFYGLAFVIVVCIWLVSFLVALSQYGTAFAVGEWYFEHHEEDGSRKILGCCDFQLTLRGIGSGLLNHSGSLAFGSLIVTACKIVRFLFAWAKKNEEVAGNPVMRAMYAVSGCIVTCITRFVEFVSTHAYVEIALTAKGFCASAQQALVYTVQHPVLFAVVGRAALGIRILGMAFVSAGSTLVAALVLKISAPPGLNSPIAPLIFAALIGIALGEVMLHPLSASSRAVLHCYIIDEDRSKLMGSHTAQKAPSKMAAFVHEHAPRENVQLG